ncbi:MAG: hypothetical protein AAF490_20640 [Chloroflexota bacterium]
MTKIKLCLITFGIIIGIIGILHGSASLMKGATPVESNTVEVMEEGWPNDEFYMVSNGSPVFTILTGIPFYALGLLAISVSTTLIAFSATFFKRQKLGIGLVLFTLLNVGIFLFGAGTGTPLFVGLPLVIAGIVSIVRTGQKERSESSKRTILYSFWFFYGLHIFSWLLFFPGLFILSFYTEISTPLFAFTFISMPIGVLGALIFGSLYDKTKKVLAPPHLPTLS